MSRPCGAISLTPIPFLGDDGDHAGAAAARSLPGVGARHAVPRRFRCGAACRAPTSPLRQRDHCPGSGRSMPCPDVSTAARLAVPRRLRCGSAIIARGWGVACRAPTFPLGRSMPRPDVSTAARQRVLCVRRNDYICRGAPRRTENRQAGHPFFWYFDAKRGICKWDVGAIATNIAVEYA
jgi:hypothetical protein